MKGIRLLIADDHQVLVEGLRELLEPEFDLVGSAADGESAIALAKSIKPHVILMDISMPGMSGVEAARRLRDEVPTAKVIILTMHLEAIYVTEALRAGVSGYVLKKSPVSVLCTAIRTVVRGGTFFSPESQSAARSAAPCLRRPHGLTLRQTEVVTLVANGKSNKEIATSLDIALKTVEYHKSAVMMKLGLRTTAELTRYAMQHGLIGSLS